MIKDIPLPDGGDWGLIPYRPTVQPSTLWADRTEGVRQFLDMFRFDFEPGDDEEFSVFDGAPGASWLDEYRRVNLQPEVASQSVQEILTLISSGVIENTNPVAISGSLNSPIIIGDDYLASNDREFNWIIDPLDFLIANAGARFGGVDEVGVSWLCIGTITEITVSGESKWQVSFEMPNAVTSTLTRGKARWTMAILDETDSENVTTRTIARGSVQVVESFA